MRILRLNAILMFQRQDIAVCGVIAAIQNRTICHGQNICAVVCRKIDAGMQGFLLCDRMRLPAIGIRHFRICVLQRKDIGGHFRPRLCFRFNDSASCSGMIGGVVGSGSDTGTLTATFSSGISSCTAGSISGMALGLAACVVKTLAVSTNRTDTQIPTHAGIRLKLKIA